MSQDQLSILERVNLQSEENNQDVWFPPSNHIEGLNPQVTVDLVRKIDALRPPHATNPRGLVIQGARGTGKTHFLRYARQRFCATDVHGWFVLIELTSAQDFWRDAAHGVIRSLLRDDQAQRLMDRLAIQTGVHATTRTAISGKGTPNPTQLNEFIGKLREIDFETGMQASDTARALALLLSAQDQQSQDAGWGYFNHLEGREHILRTAGVSNTTPSWRDIVRELSMLMARTGPTLFAVDQIDTLLAQSRRTGLQLSGRRKAALAAQAEVVRPVAHGLMDLRETTQRSVTFLSCLPASWEEIRTQTGTTAADRFETTRPLRELPSAEVARRMVEQHLGERYRAEGFEPPYPTWPVRAEAFDAATAYTARQILQRISDHIRNCLVSEDITEVTDLDAIPRPEDYKAHPAPAPTRRERALTDLDLRWSKLLAEADPAPALDPVTEDPVLPRMLTAGLQALLEEDPGLQGSVVPGEGKRPAFHAQLRLVIEDETEDEVRWTFRGAAHPNARNVQTRLKPAIEESGITPGDATRKLVIIRDSPWPSGEVTGKLVSAFASAGGIKRKIDPDDLRCLAALHVLMNERPPHLARWLNEHRPAHDIDFFKAVFGPDGPQTEAFRTTAPSDDDEGSQAFRAEPVKPTVDLTARTSTGHSAAQRKAGNNDSGPSPPSASTTTPESRGPVVSIGRSRHNDKPFTVPLELLRKHVLVVAGSGAGKTVLLKRFIEEIALQGVSSVVLDPNNDLSRLGDPWPVPPGNWLPGDAEKARAYFDDTEVLIWTPRRSAGLPLTFEPLPDLAAFRSDPDEFEAVVQSTVSVLAPKANLRGTTQKALVSQAVLTEALRFHGQGSGGGLGALIDLLEELPDTATTFDDGPNLARSMAKTLRAARVTDPLFAGDGRHTDPAELFTPSPGKRARVSVISFVGLPQQQQRQNFVSQLQLALFSWVRRNPSDRPLGGMLVMDEAQDFAPATGKTPSSTSTMQLAAQARKFGLGLAFATQAPRGLHNVVSGNTATQFIGRLTHPTQIDAAEQLARARGAEIPDVASLNAGQFYAGTEGTGMLRITVSPSLSHHPTSAPTEEDVMRSAASRRPRAAGGTDRGIGA